MSDDETRPIEPDAPVPPAPAAPAAPAAPPVPDQPAYAMPLPAGYPTYATPPPRPRFVDQVLGMRAVVAVAIACLIIGGLSGAILGRASADQGDRFGIGPGGFDQRGTFPHGQAPNGQFPNGQLPQQQFGGTP
jgi:hypothetical protein